MHPRLEVNCLVGLMGGRPDISNVIFVFSAAKVVQNVQITGYIPAGRLTNLAFPMLFSYIELLQLHHMLITVFLLTFRTPNLLTCLNRHFTNLPCLRY